MCTPSRDARAAATSARVNSTASAASRLPLASTRWNARRSRNLAGTNSSSAMPSSSATTPMRLAWREPMPWRSATSSCVSMTAEMLAAVDALRRSAIASSTTPPSASASRPRCAIGRPACSVAERSSPPSRRSSLMCNGTRRHGVPSGSHCASSVSQRSRAGPAPLRNTTPPSPIGSTANRAAAIASDNAATFMTQTAQPRPDRHARSSPHRRAGCAAADAAAPAVPRASGARRRLQHHPAVPRTRAPRGSA